MLKTKPICFGQRVPFVDANNDFWATLPGRFWAILGNDGCRRSWAILGRSQMDLGRRWNYSGGFWTLRVAFGKLRSGPGEALGDVRLQGCWG